MQAGHPVAFDEARLAAAVGRVLAIAAAPNELVQIHPLTKVDVAEEIAVDAGLRIRPITLDERDEWLNPGPFDQLVPQQTVMDIGAVIEVEYDGSDQAAAGRAHETAQPHDVTSVEASNGFPEHGLDPRGAPLQAARRRLGRGGRVLVATWLLLSTWAVVIALSGFSR